MVIIELYNSWYTCSHSYNPLDSYILFYMTEKKRRKPKRTHQLPEQKITLNTQNTLHTHCNSVPFQDIHGGNVLL